MLITTFKNKKDLIKAVSEFCGQTAKYLGAPTFSYKVGSYLIDRDGRITSEVDESELKAFLTDKGFIEPENDDTEDTVKFHIPLGGAGKREITNLLNMLCSKQELINKSVGLPILDIPISFAEDFPNKEISEINPQNIKGFEVTEENLVFHFPADEPEKLNYYMILITAAFRKAKNSTRVQIKQDTPENEKYIFRAWLLRLGLGGRENSEIRKRLLKNLSGHTAFRTPEQAEKAKKRLKARNQTE